MPYSKDKPPAAIKSLPSGAKSIWIDTFNAVHKGTGGNETQARQAAWANVKKKYKKQGDQWVPKKTGKEEKSGAFQWRAGFQEGAHPRDSKGKFAPKGSGKTGAKGKEDGGGVRGLIKGLTDLGWKAYHSSGTVIGESGDLQIMLEPKADMTSIFDAGRDIEVQMKGVKRMSPSSATRALRREYPDEYKAMTMNSQALVRVPLIITKATHTDGRMRWAATASDTDKDRYGQQTSLVLFNDWIERAETGETESWLPPPRQPYLSVAHYPDLDGLGVVGETEKMYVDGRQFKASGLWTPESEIAKAAYETVRGEQDLVKKGEGREDPVRISAAWWDVQHKHGDFVFTRKSMEDNCPICSRGQTGDVEYLQGQLEHFALTRVPVHPGTSLSLVEMSRNRQTRKSDAASIVGDELADKLDGAYADKRVKRADLAEPDVVLSDADGTGEETMDDVVLSLFDAYVLVSRADQDVDEWAVLSSVMRNIAAQEGDISQYVVGLSEELTRGTMVERSDTDGEPLGGAVTLSDALDWVVESQPGMTGWEVVEGLVYNAAGLGDDAGEVFRAIVNEFNEQVEEVTGVVMDGFLNEPVIDTEGGDEMSDVTTTTEADVLYGFTTGVSEVLQSQHSREEKLAKLQELLNGAAITLQGELDHPKDVAEAVSVAIERSLAPLASRLDQLLGGQAPAQPVQRAATQVTGEPVHRSVQSPADLAMINDPAAHQHQAPVSPVTGKPSALTALVRRSVGLSQ